MTTSPHRGFKAKTINKILTGKFLAWSKTIDDEATRKLVEQNTIITGGSIVSMLLGEEVNDFDCYFRDTATALAVANYYVKKLKEKPPAAFKDSATHTVDVSTLVEAAIPEGQEARRLGGLAVKGPLPARVRIIVKSAGIASAATQKDYQYFEGMANNPQAQAAATEAYVDAAINADEKKGDEECEEGPDDETPEPVEGEITDTTEPSSYEGNVEKLDDQGATKLEGDKKADEAKRGKYRVLFVTSNAITLSDHMQLIIRFQGPPEEIHRNFDFVHVLSYWQSWDRKLVLNPTALECIMARELRYVGSLFPICSVIRTRKFLTRGWTINAGQYVKMCYQIAQLDLNNVAVLEEQLVGVDSAYFSQLISNLQKQPDPTHIDGGYLMTLIDKIF